MIKHPTSTVIGAAVKETRVIGAAVKETRRSAGIKKHPPTSRATARREGNADVSCRGATALLQLILREVATAATAHHLVPPPGATAPHLGLRLPATGASHHRPPLSVAGYFAPLVLQYI